MVSSAASAVETGDLAIDIEDDEEVVSASARPDRNLSYISKDSESVEANEKDENLSDAEARLREELAAFKLK